MSSTYGYSARILPFAPDPQTGFSQNLTLKQVASQNLINLVLCAPGERVMYPDFGVGLRNYLFRMHNSSTMADLTSAIKNQVATYLPYITIVEINFDDSDADHNFLKINLYYEITATDVCEDSSIQGMGFAFSTGGSSFQIVEYIEDGGIIDVPGLGPTVYQTLGGECSPAVKLSPLPVTWEEEAYDDDVSDWVESLEVFDGSVSKYRNFLTDT